MKTRSRSRDESSDGGRRHHPHHGDEEEERDPPPQYKHKSNNIMIALRRLGSLPLLLGVSIAFVASYEMIRQVLLITTVNSADVERNHTYSTPHTISHQIPKIIHQTYKSNDLPHHFKVWREECIRLNPEWEFKLWTDEDNLQLVEEHYPHMLELYNSYDWYIKRVDMARYLILHKFGGLYMDFDMTCLKPFNNTFDF
jgi:mannosyltransferase OCH1-like enzyme